MIVANSFATIQLLNRASRSSRTSRKEEGEAKK